MRAKVLAVNDENRIRNGSDIRESIMNSPIHTTGRGWMAVIAGVALAVSASAQGTLNTWLGGNGDWTNTASWSAGLAPIATDVVSITNATSSYAVSINSGTTATTLTNYSLSIGHDAGSFTQTLVVSSAPAALQQQSIITIRPKGVLDVAGSTIAARSNILVQGTLISTDSVFTVSAASSSDAGLVIDGATARACFHGGSITATNTSGIASIVVGGPNSPAAVLGITNTTLNNLQIQMKRNGTVHVDNRGLTTTNNTVFAVNPSHDTPVSLTVAGGNFLNTTAEIYVQRNGRMTNSGAWMQCKSLYVGQVGGSGQSAAFVLAGGTNLFTANPARVTIGYTAGNTGTVTVTSGLLWGRGMSIGNVGGSVGVFELTGGTTSMTNANTGGAVIGVQVGPTGRGYYRQSGGTLNAFNVVLGTNAWEFQVGTAGVVRVIDATGFSNAAPASISNTFNLAGSLGFAPDTGAGVVTQHLALAGQDLGSSLNGYSNNFAVGTLDLSAFTSTRRLKVLAPSSQSSTGLYVGTLNATVATATNSLISSFNIYYDDVRNPGYAGLTYPLSGGGQLIPVRTIAEGGTVLSFR